MNKLKSVVAVATLLAAAGSSIAQNIFIQRWDGTSWGSSDYWNGATWVDAQTPLDPSQPITVNFPGSGPAPDPLGNNNIFIRVIGEGAMPANRTQTIQNLTFGGDALPGTIGLLHVIVGETKDDQPAEFPAAFRLLPSQFNSGTGTIKSLTVTGDLLTRSRLAAKLTNGVGDRVNTTIGPGNIQVGQVYILDAVNDIHGTVHAHRADWFVSGQQVPERSIQCLVAGRWIDATIQAGGAVVLFLLAQA